MPNRAIDYPRLKRLVEQHKMTHAQFGQAIDVSQATATRYIRGEQRPPEAKVIRMADLFKLDVAELYALTSPVRHSQDTCGLAAPLSLSEILGSSRMSQVPLSSGHIAIVGIIGMMTPEEAVKAWKTVADLYQRFVSERGGRESNTEGDLAESDARPITRRTVIQ